MIEVEFLCFKHHEGLQISLSLSLFLSLSLSLSLLSLSLSLSLHESERGFVLKKHRSATKRGGEKGRFGMEF